MNQQTTLDTPQLERKRTRELLELGINNKNTKETIKNGKDLNRPSQRKYLSRKSAYEKHSRFLVINEM